MPRQVNSLSSSSSSSSSSLFLHPSSFLSKWLPSPVLFNDVTIFARHWRGFPWSHILSDLFFVWIQLLYHNPTLQMFSLSLDCLLETRSMYDNRIFLLLVFEAKSSSWKAIFAKLLDGRSNTDVVWRSAVTFTPDHHDVM